MEYPRSNGLMKRAMWDDITIYLIFFGGGRLDFLYEKFLFFRSN
jgi:hypothetical protein